MAEHALCHIKQVSAKTEPGSRSKITGACIFHLGMAILIRLKKALNIKLVWCGWNNDYRAAIGYPADI